MKIWKADYGRDAVTLSPDLQILFFFFNASTFLFDLEHSRDFNIKTVISQTLFNLKLGVK